MTAEKDISPTSLEIQASVEKPQTPHELFSKYIALNMGFFVTQNYDEETKTYRRQMNISKNEEMQSQLLVSAVGEAEGIEKIADKVFVRIPTTPPEGTLQASFRLSTSSYLDTSAAASAFVRERQTLVISLLSHSKSGIILFEEDGVQVQSKNQTDFFIPATFAHVEEFGRILCVLTNETITQNDMSGDLMDPLE